MVRIGGDTVRYLSADATSLNTLIVRIAGERIEFSDRTVDGGIDPGTCDPGAIIRAPWIVQVLCSRERLDAAADRPRRARGQRRRSTCRCRSSCSVAPAPTCCARRRSADRVEGGDGNDDVAAGGGNDVVDGGLGYDVVAAATATTSCASPTACWTASSAARAVTASMPTRSTTSPPTARRSSRRRSSRRRTSVRPTTAGPRVQSGGPRAAAGPRPRSPPRDLQRARLPRRLRVRRRRRHLAPGPERPPARHGRRRRGRAHREAEKGGTCGCPPRGARGDRASIRMSRWHRPCGQLPAREADPDQTAPLTYSRSDSDLGSSRAACRLAANHRTPRECGPPR